MLRLQRDLSRAIRLIEDVYGVALLLGLTQGPILQIWWLGAAQAGFDTKAAVASSHLLLQLPAIMLLGRLASRERLRNLPVVILLSLIGWLLVSTFWATLSVAAVTESLSLLSTTLAAFYLLIRHQLSRLFLLTCVAMQIGIAWSMAAIAFGWERAVGDGGVWVGIYFNRNSLAPPAAVGWITACGLMLLIRFPKHGIQRVALPITLYFVIVLDAFVLYRTESQTSIYGSLAGLLIAALSRLRLGRQKNREFRSSTRSISWLFLSGASLLPWLHQFFQRQNPNLFRRIDFNGREAIWNFVIDGFLKRPLLGWGWMSAWQTPEFLRLDEWWLWEGKLAGPYSHSAYLDVLLGGGLFAAVLFIATTTAAFKFHARQTSGNSNLVSTWLTMFVLITSTQESFFTGNHILLVLLIIGLLAPCLRNIDGEIQNHLEQDE